MLLAAALTGVLASLLIEWFHRKARLQSDASIGITFTWLFAIGVILITKFAADVDLDQDCVLYGEIAYLPLDTWVSSGGLNLGPKAIWLLGGNMMLVLIFVIMGFRGLQISTFDPGFAASIGLSTVFWHYGLMSAVSLTTVFSFESVGAILVLALLVVPPSSAFLLTGKLKTMLILASIFGVLSALGGYLLATQYDASIAASMAMVSGFIFILCLIFSPSQGMLKKYWKSGGLFSGKQLSKEEFQIRKSVH
jgi:manganese/zinc/iron transport system permease protein